MIKLSVQIEFDKTMDLTTHKKTVLVGRDEGCDLKIPHVGVSRKHCKLEDIEGKLFITDLDSSNGVFLNGERLDPNKRTGFKISDQIRFGGIHVKVDTQDIIPDDTKVIQTNIDPKNDVTATLRIARLELQEPSRAPSKLELEQKKKKPTGPRNPVSHGAHDDEIEIVKRPPYMLISIILGLLAFGYYFFFM